MNKFSVGQKVWWKNPNTGREFFAVIREINHSAEGYYDLSAVFADNCLDMPDNWAAERDLRPVEPPPVSPTTVDVSTISEYGLTQKLSNSIRVY